MSKSPSWPPPPPPDSAPPPVPLKSESQEPPKRTFIVPKRTQSKAPPPRSNAKVAVTTTGSANPPAPAANSISLGLLPDPLPASDPLDDYIKKYADSLPRQPNSLSTGQSNTMTPPPRGASSTRSPPGSLPRESVGSPSSQRRPEGINPSGSNNTSNSFGRPLPQRPPTVNTGPTPTSTSFSSSRIPPSQLQNSDSSTFPSRPSRGSPIPPRGEQSLARSSVMPDGNSNSVNAGTAESMQVKIWARTVKAHHESKLRAMEAQQVAETRTREVEGKLSDALDAELALREEVASLKQQLQSAKVVHLNPPQPAVGSGLGNFGIETATGAVEKKMKAMQQELDNLLIKHSQAQDSLNGANARIQAFETKTASLKTELANKDKRLDSVTASLKESERRVTEAAAELRERDAKLRKLRGERSASTLSEVSVNSSKRVKSLMQGMVDLEELKQSELDDLKRANTQVVKRKDAEISRLKELLTIQASDASAAIIRELEAKLAATSSPEAVPREHNNQQMLERRLKSLETNTKLEIEALNFQLSQSIAELEEMRNSYEDAEFKSETLQLQHESDIRELESRYELEIKDLKDKLETTRVANADERDSLLTDIFNLENVVEGMKRSHAKELKALSEQQRLDMQALKNQIEKATEGTNSSPNALETLQVANRQLEASLQISQQQKVTLEAELDSVSAQLDSIILKQTQESITHKSDLIELKEKCESLEAANLALDEQCRETNSRMSAMRAKLGKIEVESLTEAERARAEIQGLEEAGRVLEAELNSSNDEFVLLIDKMRASDAAKLSLEKEVATLLDKLQTYEESKNSKGDSMIDDASWKRMLDIAEQDLILAREEVQELKRKNADLVATRNDGLQGLSDNNEFEEEIKSLKQMLEDLNEDYSSLQSELRELKSGASSGITEALEAAKDEILDLKQMMEDLNADYDLLEAAHASLKEKLHDPSSVKDSTGLDDKLRNALKEFEELQSELTILKTENDLLQANNDAIKWSLSEAQNALEEERSANSNSSAGVLKLKADVDDLKEKLRQALLDLVDANDHISELEFDKKRVQKSEVMNAGSPTVKDVVPIDSGQNIQELNNQLSIVQQQKAVLLEQLKSTEEHAIKIREEYTTKESQLQQTIFSLQKSLNDALLRLESAREASSRNSDSNNAALIQQLEADIEGLNRDLDNADADIQELQTQLDDYHATVKELEEREIFLEDTIEANDAATRELEAKYLQQGVKIEQQEMSERKLVSWIVSLINAVNDTQHQQNVTGGTESGMLESLQNDVDSFRAENAALSAQLAELLENIKDLEATNDSQESALEASRTEIEAFEFKIINLRSELAQAKEDLEIALDECEMAGKSASSLDAVHQRELSKLENRRDLDELESQIAILTTAIEASKSDIRSCEAKFLTQGLSLEYERKCLVEAEARVWAMEESAQSIATPSAIQGTIQSLESRIAHLTANEDMRHSDMRSLEAKFLTQGLGLEYLSKCLAQAEARVWALENDSKVITATSEFHDAIQSLKSQILHVTEIADKRLCDLRSTESKFLTQALSVEYLQNSLTRVESRLREIQASGHDASSFHSQEAQTIIQSLEGHINRLTTDVDNRCSESRAIEAKFLTQGLCVESLQKMLTKAECDLLKVSETISVETTNVKVLYTETSPQSAATEVDDPATPIEAVTSAENNNMQDKVKDLEAQIVSLNSELEHSKIQFHELECLLVAERSSKIEETVSVAVPEPSNNPAVLELKDQVALLRSILESQTLEKRSLEAKFLTLGVGYEALQLANSLTERELYKIQEKGGLQTANHESAKELQAELHRLDMALDDSRSQVRALESKFLTQAIRLELCIKSENALFQSAFVVQQANSIIQENVKMTPNDQKDDLIESLMIKSKQTQDQNLELQEQIQEYHLSVEKLREQVSTLEVALLNNRAQMIEMDARLSESEEERGDDAQLEQIVGLQTQVAGLKETNSCLFDQLKQYETKIEELQQMSDSRPDTFSKEVSEEGDPIVQSTKDVEDMQIMLKNAYDQVAKLSEEKDVLQEQNEMLLFKLEQAQSKTSPPEANAATKKKGFFY